MKSVLPFAIMGLAIAPVAASAANWELAAIFCDHAVLQRNRPVPVWGWGEPGDIITVEFAGQKQTATADASGRWIASLAPMPACDQPRSLTVAGKSTVTVRHVLVGDVFLMAGGVEVGRRAADLEPAGNVRVFAVAPATARQLQQQPQGRWTPSSEASLKTLPAEAVLFGQAIAEKRRVPVGVIAASVPYPVESWMSQESLAATPAAAPILAFYASNAWKMRTTGTYEDRLKAWTDYCQKLPLNPPPKPRPDDVDVLAKQEPSGVWNAMIGPLAPLTLCGVVWDNGEDWGSQNRAFQQGQLLSSMIADWRRAFGDPALPVTIVQVRPHRYALPFGIDGRLAAELRDAQRAAAAQAKASLVVTIDLGADPPARLVAQRIARAILEPAECPHFSQAERRGDKIVLRFANLRGGLAAKGGSLRGFAVAASMFRWVWADAKIEGDSVIVSVPVVPNPQGVRYAYEDLPSQGATLCDGAGTPVAPFRTDDNLSLTAKHLDPSAEVVRFNPRVDLGVEDVRLPRILIIGDSISGHYLYGVRERMRGKANVIGESSMRDNAWPKMGPRFYRSDWASKGDDLKNFLAERGPFHIVHFNNGIHNFSRANPGDEKPYAEQLRKVVATIRDSGAVCLFANSTGTVADNTIPSSPRYLTNCLAFNAAAEAVMREMNVPVTDIHGLIQPRIKELISADLIHTNKQADEMMADLITNRLKETLATIPKGK